MAKLIFVSNVTRDGFSEDVDGKFDFTEPGDEVFAFITDLIRPVGTHVYGRRMYAMRAMKVAATTDLMIGGPTLTAHAFAAGLVDEFHLFISPVVVGAGKRSLPTARTELTLLDEHRFASGTVHLHYGIV